MSYNPIYWANQGHFDQLHQNLINPIYGPYQITRQKYVEEINKSRYAIDPTLLPGLQSRIDRDKRSGRTLGLFALFIHDNTVRERFLLDAWLAMTGREGKVEDFGIANDGRLILNTGGGLGRPDFLLDGVKFDVKFNPVSFKHTFKVCDLKSYARDDVQVLLIMGESRMIGPNGNPDSQEPLVVPPNLKWSLFGRGTIRTMLSKLPTLHYREVGFKPAIQLKGEDINLYLSPKDWVYEKAFSAAD
jgi:hypothetical protein